MFCSAMNEVAISEEIVSASIALGEEIWFCAPCREWAVYYIDASGWEMPSCHESA